MREAPSSMKTPGTWVRVAVLSLLTLSRCDAIASWRSCGSGANGLSTGHDGARVCLGPLDLLFLVDDMAPERAHLGLHLRELLVDALQRLFPLAVACCMFRGSHVHVSRRE